MNISIEQLVVYEKEKKEKEQLKQQEQGQELHVEVEYPTYDDEVKEDTAPQAVSVFTFNM